MKNLRWIGFLVLVIFFSSCESTPEPTPILPDVTLEIYHDGYFQAVVPDWPDNPGGDVETIFSVEQDGYYYQWLHFQQAFQRHPNPWDE